MIGLYILGSLIVIAAANSRLTKFEKIGLTISVALIVSIFGLLAK